MTYLLFYSKYCKFSKQFISTLEKTREYQNFKMVSVEKKNGKRPDIVAKYNVREVPTIVINGNILSGEKAFAWLNNVINSSGRQISSMSTRQNKTIENVISGFAPDSNFIGANCPEQWNNANDSSSVIGELLSQRIITPEENSFSKEQRESGFVMTSDNITGLGDIPPSVDGRGNNADKKTSRSGNFDSEFKKMQEMRSIMDKRLKPPNPNYF